MNQKYRKYKILVAFSFYKEIPKNYFFSVSEQPLLFSDEVLKDVQDALRTTKHIEIQNI